MEHARRPEAGLATAGTFVSSTETSFTTSDSSWKIPAWDVAESWTLHGIGPRKGTRVDDAVLACAPSDERVVSGALPRDASKLTVSPAAFNKTETGMSNGTYTTKSAKLSQNPISLNKGSNQLSSSIHEPHLSRVVNSSLQPSPPSDPQKIERCLGLVHVVRQLTGTLKLIMEAMDACFAHATAGTLTLAMIDLISEQFEFVSSAVALHQSNVNNSVIPFILEAAALCSSPPPVPPNLQALYRMAEVHRGKAHAVLEQLSTRRYKHGIPRDLFASARDLMHKYYEVCIHAAKIEFDVWDQAVMYHANDDKLIMLQTKHFETMLAEPTSRNYVAGLLFLGVPMSRWSSIGTAMGPIYPGRLTLIWATFQIGRTLDTPLRRLIESQPQQCDSIAVCTD